MSEHLIFRSDRLLAAIQRKGWSFGKLQLVSGVSKSQISLLTRDARPNVSAVIAAKLAEALDVDIAYLLNMSDEPTRQRSEGALGEERSHHRTTAPLTDGQRAILEFFESLSADEQQFVLELVSFVRQRNMPRIIE